VRRQDFPRQATAAVDDPQHPVRWRIEDQRLAIVGARIVRRRRFELRFACQHAIEKRAPRDVRQEVVDQRDRVAYDASRGSGRLHVQQADKGSEILA
jgi:hypothetical protein